MGFKLCLLDLHSNPPSFAVLISSRLSDDALDVVAITDSITEPLQYQCCDSLTTCIPVCSGIYHNVSE